MRIKPALVLLALLPLLGSSCLSSTSAKRVGGVFVSEDSGKTWVDSNTITNSENTSLERFDIIDLLFDPNDSSTLYAATGQAGLYKTVDGAKTWVPLTTKGRIEAVDVHKQEQALLVAARDNQIFLSKDAGKVWNLVYTDPSNAKITDVVFHTISTSQVFATTSSGKVLESTDQARSWRLLYDFKKPIQSIQAHPRLATALYVLQTDGKLFYSESTGKEFRDISEGVRSLFTNTAPLEVLVHPLDKNALMLATSKKIYKTANLGQDWIELPILSTANEAIQSIGWDPQRSGILYYATPNVFYRSNDSGVSWETSIFVSSRLPKQLLVHPENSDILVIATKSD